MAQGSPRLELRVPAVEQEVWREHGEGLGYASLSEFVRACVRSQVEGVGTPPESLVAALQERVSGQEAEITQLRDALSAAERVIEEAKGIEAKRPKPPPQGALRRYVCSKCKQLHRLPRCPEHPEARQQPV